MGLDRDFKPTIGKGNIVRVIKTIGIVTKNPSIFEIDTKQMKIELTKRAKNIDFYK